MTESARNSAAAGQADATDDRRAEMPPSNRLIDALERVLPDMPMLGVFVLLLTVYLAATGSLGMSAETSEAMQAATEAAATNGAAAF